MPEQLFCSRNYFNPQWSGLRRIKNVIMVLEWAPAVPTTVSKTSTAPPLPAVGDGVVAGQALGDGFRLLTPEEHAAAAPPLAPARQDALRKAFLLLSGGRAEGLAHADLANAIQAVTDAAPTAEQVAAAVSAAAAAVTAAAPGAAADCVSLAGFSELLKTRHLLPAYHGRYYVAVSVSRTFLSYAGLLLVPFHCEDASLLSVCRFYLMLSARGG